MGSPKDLLYTDSHEWVRDEGNHITFGITDYAQRQLKDIVYVELPQVGSEFGRGENIGLVESVKTVADLFCPMTGRFTEVNSTLKDHPQFVNEDPYSRGWMGRIAIADRAELKGLLSADAYEHSLVLEEQ